MKEYMVWGKVTVYVNKKVMAESAEEAVEKAADEFGGISGFVGNNGTNKLIGVHGSDEGIECDFPEIEWETPEEE